MLSPVSAAGPGGPGAGFQKAPVMAEVSLAQGGAAFSGSPRAVALAASTLDPMPKELVRSMNKQVLVLVWVRCSECGATRDASGHESLCKALVADCFASMPTKLPDLCVPHSWHEPAAIQSVVSCIHGRGLDCKPCDDNTRAAAQVLVVVTAGWHVLCFDHNLKLMWDRSIRVRPRLRAIRVVDSQATQRCVSPFTAAVCC